MIACNGISTTKFAIEFELWWKMVLDPKVMLWRFFRHTLINLQLSKLTGWVMMSNDKIYRYIFPVRDNNLAHTGLNQYILGRHYVDFAINVQFRKKVRPPRKIGKLLNAQLEWREMKVIASLITRNCVLKRLFRQQRKDNYSALPAPLWDWKP